MSNNCPICHRSLGTAYHGKTIKKNFCCLKCEKYFKEHFCTMHMRGENRNNCNNKLFNTEKKFCSEVCKKKFFETGKKPLDIRECSKCKGIKHYINFRIRRAGWKSVCGNYRQSSCRDCENQKQKDSRETNPIHRLFLLARRRSIRDNLSFNLTEEYIKSIWPRNNKCPIFETEFKSGLKDRDCLPTIDKIVPKKGYTKGNVAIISFRANSLKSDITDIKYFKRIYDFYKTK